VCAGSIDWSPTGEWIALEQASPNTIGLVHPDGTGLQPLQACAGGGSDPTFSPEGNTVALSTTNLCEPSVGPGAWGIYGIDIASGKVVQRFADTQVRGPGTEYIARDLDWNTSGPILTWFSDYVDGGTCHPLGYPGSHQTADAYRLTAVTDSPLVRIGNSTGEFDMMERYPTWSPSATRIAFSGIRNTGCDSNGSYTSSGREELYVMNANGSGTTLVYTPPGTLKTVVYAAWQPCVSTTNRCG
ncbi:MAG: hypothetical protein ABIO83_06270, partial [Ilumatobacteraceae bacterium]